MESGVTIRIRWQNHIKWRLLYVRRNDFCVRARLLAERVERARINVCMVDWLAIWSNGKKHHLAGPRPQQTVERTKKDYRLLVFFNRQNAMILFFRSLAPLTCNFSYIVPMFFFSSSFYSTLIQLLRLLFLSVFIFLLRFFFHFFSILCECRARVCMRSIWANMVHIPI